ncbi:FtsX-like permease family protein [Texas Phoenix palm phytoplasma]|uniref:FtsX-like permease family protein n=2 Tax=Texas Phoenix palm phytoplasma TaxID=176709 RepID=A0ABS5BJ52_9MOLU|nr:FtsX-like permease family protein [Texas Phoenix palm phytoplasma]
MDLDKSFKMRKINELSGGQKQRISIIRALVKDSKVILADEPTSNIDSDTSKRIFNRFKKISKNKLLIIVTHDEDKAYKYADRIIKIQNGSIIEDNLITKTESLKPKKEISISNNMFQVKENNYEKDEFISIFSFLNMKLIFKMAISILKCKKLFLLFICTFMPIIFACLYGFPIMCSIFFSQEKNSFVPIEFFHLFSKMMINVSKTQIFDFFIKILIFFCLLPFLILLLYFSLSIRLKKKEIGILKGLGSNNYNIFKIFLVECFLFSLINFILSLFLLIFLSKSLNIYNSTNSDSNFIVNFFTFSIHNDVLKKIILEQFRHFEISYFFISPIFRILSLSSYLFILIFLFSFLCLILPIFQLLRKKTIDILK